jgi:hypothetical protein
MNSKDSISNDYGRQPLAGLDAELARIDARLDQRSRQRMAVERLRAVCEPYMRDNPGLTVREALALDRSRQA